jgi:hypothetical protein
MRHGQHDMIPDPTQGLPARLSVLGPLKEAQSKCIGERQARGLEAQAMLIPVGRVLVVVPFEAHAAPLILYLPNCMYVLAFTLSMQKGRE